jgi:hypothetical protein
VNPAEFEQCDGKDNDCNESIDDGFQLPGCNYYFLDLDDDGYGVDGAEPECHCTPTGLFRAEEQGDCLDNNAAVNPGEAEVCGDDIDNNCNELQNEVDAEGCQEFYRDGDLDEYGTDDSLCLCEASGWFEPYTAPQNGDCNDSNAAINPGADEMCWDGLDNDCSGAQDDDAVDCVTFFLDADEDYFGVEGDTVCICSELGEGDYTAWEGGDCDDNNAQVNPEMEEICGNEVDENCNWLFNEVDAQDCIPFYQDNDGDDFGTGESVCLCEVSEFYLFHTATQDGDCNDMNQMAYPEAPEAPCGEVEDLDCDGVVPPEC